MINLLYPYKRPPYGDDDIKYSVRSACAHLPVRSLWVAGDVPDTFSASKSRLVENRNGRIKYTASFRNVMAAISRYDFPNDFLLMNDDIMLTQDYPQGFPVLFREPIGEWLKSWPVSKRRKYWRIMAETAAIVGDDFPSFAVHCPMPMERERMVWTALRHNLPRPLSFRTLYAFDHGLNLVGERTDDNKALRCEDLTKAIENPWFSMADGLTISYQFRTEVAPSLSEKCRFEKQ